MTPGLIDNQQGTGVLQQMWDFVPSVAQPQAKRERLYSVIFQKCSPPEYKVLKPAFPAPRWIAYFAYCPHGQLAPHHEYSLNKFRETGLPVLLVCAQPGNAVPPALLARVDALIVKGLRGFDFSAYSLMLQHLTQCAPHTQALLLNDSVFGPFSDLRPFFDHARWDLTGWTSSGEYENHVQSFGFFLKDITAARLQQLGNVFERAYCFNAIDPVVRLQETRFARLAARHMSVGSFWHEGGGAQRNPLLNDALVLLKDGFPFLKRALLGKYPHKQDRHTLLSLLEQHEHPLA